MGVRRFRGNLQLGRNRHENRVCIGAFVCVHRMGGNRVRTNGKNIQSGVQFAAA